MSEKIFFYNDSSKEAVDKLPNRTLFFGEGVFETFRYKSELPVYFNRHIERLKKGCEFLRIPLPDKGSIEKFISNSVQKSQFKDAYVKLGIFSAGSNQYQDYPVDCFIMAVIREFKNINSEMSVCISKETKNSNSSLNFHKTTNYVQNIISKRQAIESGFNEALFLNEKDHITECTSHNIFWIENNMVFTPALQNGLLPGITRSVLLETTKDLGMEVLEGDFTYNDLIKADFIFLTNAIKGMVLVTKLEHLRLNRNTNKFGYIQNNLLTRLKWN